MSQQIMSIVSIVTGVDEDLGNSVCLPYYDGLAGSSTPESTGQVCLNVNDADTVKYLIHATTITIGQVRSIHDISGTSYQNLSGKDAFVILVITAKDNGTTPRNIKILDAPTADSSAGATLRLETGLLGVLDGQNEKLTMGIAKISNNNFCNIENSTGAGNNDISVDDVAYAVERG